MAVNKYTFNYFVRIADLSSMYNIIVDTDTEKANTLEYYELPNQRYFILNDIYIYQD